MTKNTVQRLMIFFLGIPAFIAVVLFLSFGRNVILLAVVLAVQALGAREAVSLFKAKGVAVSRGYLTALSIGASAIVYASPALSPLFPSSPGSLEWLLGSTAIGSLAAIAPFAFAKSDAFPLLLARMSASLFVFFYCGALGAFLVYITSCFGQSVAPVLTFALMTFGNDSLAWLVGVTLGRKRGIVAVSPGKSLAGFIGGFAGSIAAGALSFLLFPEAGFGSVLGALILGLATACTTILGDLVESAMKRSASVKDSSGIVPGRGGILDSFDSLLFSAPVFVVIAAFMGFFPSLR